MVVWMFAYRSNHLESVFRGTLHHILRHLWNSSEELFVCLLAGLLLPIVLCINVHEIWPNKQCVNERKNCLLCPTCLLSNLLCVLRRACVRNTIFLHTSLT